MNMPNERDRRDPARAQGLHAPADAGAAHGAKPRASAAHAPESPQLGARMPPRVRKVDCGEVFRFWAFR